MSEQRLLGVTVLLTRPQPQAVELSEAVQAQGGMIVSFPVIDIKPRAEVEIENELATLPAADITIFISRNAVEHGLRFASGKCAAIGPTTNVGSHNYLLLSSSSCREILARLALICRSVALR